MRYKKEAFSLNEHPVFFYKRAILIIGFTDEVKLVAVIEKTAEISKKDEVKDVIFGYTIFNDISACTIQTSHKQWYFGKSLDTFTFMDSVIVTADEFEWPVPLNVQTRINHELRQNGNTKDFIFDIEHIDNKLKQGMRLKIVLSLRLGHLQG